MVWRQMKWHYSLVLPGCYRTDSVPETKPFPASPLPLCPSAPLQEKEKPVTAPLGKDSLCGAQISFECANLQIQYAPMRLA